MSDRRFFQPFVYTPSMDGTPRSVGSLLGEPIPTNVADVNIWERDRKIVWRTRSGTHHEMDWPADGDVMPVIVAMRMSC